MLAAGAAYGDNKLGLALVYITGDQETEQVLELFYKLVGDGPAQHVVPDGLLFAAEIPQGLVVMGIGQEAHVEDQVGIHGQTVLETKGNHSDIEQLALDAVPGEKGKQFLPQLCRLQG